MLWKYWPKKNNDASGLWCDFQTGVGLARVETLFQKISSIFPHLLLKKKNPKEAKKEGKI